MVEELAGLSSKDRLDWFLKNARRQKDAPPKSEFTYWILIGTTTRFFAGDTAELRQKFERYLALYRRRARYAARKMKKRKAATLQRYRDARLGETKAKRKVRK